MKFQVDRESVDGLVLIDRGSMKELDDDLLYAFDILHDNLTAHPCFFTQTIARDWSL